MQFARSPQGPYKPGMAIGASLDRTLLASVYGQGRCLHAFQQHRNSRFVLF